MSELTGVDYTRLQAIKEKHERMDEEVSRNELEVKIGSVHGDRACLLKVIEHLQVALQESQRINADLKTELKSEQCTAMKWHDELADAQQALAVKDDTIKFLDSNRAEAQQTIARQRDALEKIANYTGIGYESAWRMAVSLASTALGKGTEEEVISFPNCPICNGNKTIAHPSKAGTWLCVPCDKVFEEGAKES